MGPEGITGGSAIGDGWRDSRNVDGIWPVVSTGSTTRPPGARRVRGLDGLDHPGADGNSGFVRDHATMLDSTRVRIQVPIVAISDASVAPTKGLPDGRQCTGDGTSGRVLRPRQDDHREVEHARVQQAVPGRRPDLAPGGAP